MSEGLIISIITAVTSIVIAAIIAFVPMYLQMRKSRLQQRCRIVEQLAYKRYRDVQYLFECRDELLADLSKLTGKPEVTLKIDLNKRVMAKGYDLFARKSNVNAIVNKGEMSIGDIVDEILINSTGL